MSEKHLREIIEKQLRENTNTLDNLTEYGLTEGEIISGTVHLQAAWREMVPIPIQKFCAWLGKWQ